MQKNKNIGSVVDKIRVHWTLKVAGVIIVILTLNTLVDSQFDYNFIDNLLGLFADKTKGGVGA